MRALIIAAGRGERLRPLTDSNPKPLIPLLGLRLIERVILSAKEAGIFGFVIATGYLGERVRSFLGDGSRYGVNIEYVESKFWSMGNGLSVFEARKLLDEKFILLMSDHIFNPKILVSLMDCDVKGDECVLCVDVGMRSPIDFNDATKVMVLDGRIVDIGKNLNEYNGVDMGIFLCSPIIFDALGDTIREGLYSLTDGVRELARRRKMRAHCIDEEEAYWIDIDTLESLKAAERILLFHNSEMYGFKGRLLQLNEKPEVSVKT
jgi:NDP-sugar pyrophosphorylase family protein